MSFGGATLDQTILPGAVRLLVVDDDVTIRRAVGTGLARAGFQVMTADDATTAITQVAETPPDVAIVDLGMPGCSGVVVIKHLKEMLGASVHVIVLTGKDDERSRAGAFDAGTDDYVLKPIPLAEICRRIAAAVRKQREFVQVRLEKEATERRLVYGQEANALLAHDLNNGLSVSLSNLSFLIDTVTCDADQTEALAATLRSVRRMSGLVANFVDISRFEDAAVKPVATVQRVRQLLQSVVEVNAHAARDGITVELDCEPELEGRFDGGLVERVLHNLFGNAARYCNANGTITLGGHRWQETKHGVEISVMNTGPTIPDTVRPNLFGKYVQGKGGKRGLGLYFCRLVAEAHGGRIDCESRPEGPRFLVRLPGRV